MSIHLSLREKQSVSQGGFHHRGIGSAGAVPIADRDTLEQTSRTARWMVVIYNNDHNSVDEVVAILIYATGCDIQEAMIETLEADTFGKASVHFAPKPECQLVAGVIAGIGVKAEVFPEWDD